MARVCVGPEFCTDKTGQLIMRAVRNDNYLVAKSGFKIAYALGFRMGPLCYAKFAIQNLGADITASANGNVAPDREIATINVNMRPIWLHYTYAALYETMCGGGVRVGSDGSVGLIHFNNSAVRWPKDHFLYVSDSWMTTGVPCGNASQREIDEVSLPIITEEPTMNPNATDTAPFTRP